MATERFADAAERARTAEATAGASEASARAAVRELAVVTADRDKYATQMSEASEEMERILSAHGAERDRLLRQLAEAMRKLVEATEGGSEAVSALDAVEVSVLVNTMASEVGGIEGALEEAAVPPRGFGAPSACCRRRRICSACTRCVGPARRAPARRGASAGSDATATAAGCI